MFGYVKPDNPNMFVKDERLYKATYCGLCKSLAKETKQRSRFLLSYDLAFLSHFIHNVKNQDVTIKNERCVTHWIKKRPIAKPTEISLQIARLNVILAYYKIGDDIIDSNKGKFKRSLFKSSYKKAVKKEPILDKIVKEAYQNLYEYEKKNGDSPLVASEFFGQMLSNIVKELCKEYSSSAIENLSFNLGKWIYLIDALDDYEKDIKNNEYNPFYLQNKTIKTKKELLEKNAQNISFLFSDVLFEIKESNEKIKYYFNHDLIDNILLKGLYKTTKEILEGK